MRKDVDHRHNYTCVKHIVVSLNQNRKATGLKANPGTKSPIHHAVSQTQLI